MKTEIQNKAN